MKNDFTDEQAEFAVRQALGGTRVRGVCGEPGIRDPDELPLEAQVRSNGRRRGAQTRLFRGGEPELQSAVRPPPSQRPQHPDRDPVFARIPRYLNRMGYDRPPSQGLDPALEPANRDLAIVLQNLVVVPITVPTYA
jgi:hypothetical protein